MKTSAELDAMAASEPALGGRCGFCDRDVTNAADRPDHRITPIAQGGRGVECRARGDFE